VPAYVGTIPHVSPGLCLVLVLLEINDHSLFDQYVLRDAAEDHRLTPAAQASSRAQACVTAGDVGGKNDRSSLHGRCPGCRSLTPVPSSQRRALRVDLCPSDVSKRLLSQSISYPLAERSQRLHDLCLAHATASNGICTSAVWGNDSPRWTWPPSPQAY